MRGLFLTKATYRLLRAGYGAALIAAATSHWLNSPRRVTYPNVLKRKIR